MTLNEATVEHAALEWFGELGNVTTHEPLIDEITRTMTSVIDPHLPIVSNSHNTLLPKLLSRDFRVADLVIAEGV